MEYASVAVPRSEAELCVMLSMLVAHDIPHYVHNRGFGALHPGMQIPLYNVQRVMVPASSFAEALDLFVVFRDSYETEPDAERLGIGDRLRVFVEVVFGNWAVPIKYRKFDPEREEGELA